MDSAIRVKAEGSGILAKAFLTVILLYYDSRYRSGDLGLLGFSVGQLAYSVALVYCYVSKYGGSVPFMPRSSGRDRSFQEYVR